MRKRWRRAGQGDAGRLWVTAARQPAGRGRRGRDWVSRAGQSLRLPASDRPGAAAADRHVAAGCRARACMTRCSGTAALAIAACAAIKWPNDILIDGAKICRHAAWKAMTLRWRTGGRHRLRHQLRAPPDRRALSGDRRSPNAASPVTPETLFVPLSREWRNAAAMGRGRGLRRSATTGWRAAGHRQDRGRPSDGPKT